MDTFREKVYNFFGTIKQSKKLSLIAILLLVAAIPITVYIAQTQQEIRQRASTSQVAVTVLAKTVRPGGNLAVNWNIIASTPTPTPTTTAPTPTNSPIPSPADTPTPTTSPCPMYTRSTTVDGKAMLVTLTAAPNNPIKQLQFTQTTNGAIIIDGATGTNGKRLAPLTYDVPADTSSVTFLFVKEVSGQAATVNLNVIDNCGAKPDFYGLGAEQGYNMPLLDLVKKAYAQTAITGAETFQLFRVGAGNQNVEAAGEKLFLNCQSTPPNAPIYSGTCQYPIPTTTKPDTYIIRMLAADGTTVLGESNTFSVTTASPATSCTTDADCNTDNTGKTKCMRYQNYPGSCQAEDTVCAQVITRACNPSAPFECVDFPNPCVVPPGWTNTPLPTPGGTGGTLTGNLQLSGVVFEDINANGIYEPGGDKIISSQPVELRSVTNHSEPGTILIAGTTDVNGEFKFDGLENGKMYRVTYLTPEGFRRTNDNSRPFFMTAGLTQNFGITLANVTPTLTVTPTVTPPETSTQFNFTIYFTGIGQPSGTAAPKHPSRKLVVTLFNTSNTPVATKDGTITYNPASGNFQGSVDMGEIPVGNYVVKVLTPQFLRKQLPGIIPIAVTNSTLTLPPLTLTPGDINGDNKVDILDYNLLLGCFGNKMTTPACLQSPQFVNGTAPAMPLAPLADLNDDGVVDGPDYNLFVRSLATKEGD